MKFNWQLYILLFLSCPLVAQESNLKFCDCTKYFSYVQTKVQTNYVAYADKLYEKEKRFASFTKKITNQVRTENRTSGCLFRINTWLHWFDDAHLRVNLSDQSAQNIRSIFSATNTVDFSEKSFKEYIIHNKNRDSLEGIWQNTSGDFVLGIKKEQGNFTGFIIKFDSILWLPGQVIMNMYKKKNTYMVDWFDWDHYSIIKYTPIISRNTLQIGGLQLHKIFPDYPQRNGSNRAKSSRIEFKSLTNETCLLTLKTFDISYKKIIDSIITKNVDILTSTRNLIIDLRGNTGGLTPSFEKVIPFLYTNPFLIEGSSILATTQNIQLYSRLSSESEKNMTPERRKSWERRIQHMKAYEGSMTPTTNDTLIYLDTVYQFPQRVAILTDEYTASSAEFFILRAKQSTKVKTFGQPTMGAVDYVDMVIDRDVPDKLFSLNYPITKTSRRVKDPKAPIHIPPDIFLKQPKIDWIDLVQNYLKQPEW